jgi:hypothetical protein
MIKQSYDNSQFKLPSFIWKPSTHNSHRRHHFHQITSPAFVLHRQLEPPPYPIENVKKPIEELIHYRKSNYTQFNLQNLCN